MRSIRSEVDETVRTTIPTQKERRVPNAYHHYLNGWDGIAIGHFTRVEIPCNNVYYKILVLCR
jgi:hypothetical protein